MPTLTTTIREHRQKAGLKQEDLAELVNVRRETIFRLEKGAYNPSLKLAMDIANIFNLAVEDLFSFENAEDD